MTEFTQPTPSEIACFRLIEGERIAYQYRPNEPAAHQSMVRQADLLFLILIALTLIIAILDRHHFIWQVIAMTILCILARVAVAQYRQDGLTNYAITNLRVISSYLDEGTPVVKWIPIREVAQTSVTPWRGDRTIGTVTFVRPSGWRRKVAFACVDQPYNVETAFKAAQRDALML